PGPALVRGRSRGLGHGLTLRDVALRALAADLHVLRVGVEDGSRRGAADQAGTEEHEELTCHGRYSCDAPGKSKWCWHRGGGGGRAPAAVRISMARSRERPR